MVYYRRLYERFASHPAICKPKISIHLTPSDHTDTLVLLNTHARVLASYEQTGSPKFYKLFDDFIKLFVESGNGCDVGYLVGNPTEVTKAYWAFITCIKTEVTSVAQ